MNDAVKKSTEAYLDISVEQTELKAAAFLTQSLIESTALTDKLGNYLLVVAGAAITLMVSNSDSTISTLGPGTFKIFIILMLVSAFIGFGSKLTHSLSLMYLNLHDATTNKFLMLLDEFDALQDEAIEECRGLAEIEPRYPDKDRILNNYIANHPKFMQQRMLKNAQVGKQDAYNLLRSANFLAYWHVGLVTMEIVLMAAAFSVVVFGVE